MNKVQLSIGLAIAIIVAVVLIQYAAGPRIKPQTINGKIHKPDTLIFIGTIRRDNKIMDMYAITHDSTQTLSGLPNIPDTAIIWSQGDIVHIQYIKSWQK